MIYVHSSRESCEDCSRKREDGHEESEALGGFNFVPQLLGV